MTRDRQLQKMKRLLFLVDRMKGRFARPDTIQEKGSFRLTDWRASCENADDLEEARELKAELLADDTLGEDIRQIVEGINLESGVDILSAIVDWPTTVNMFLVKAHQEEKFSLLDIRMDPREGSSNNKPPTDTTCPARKGENGPFQVRAKSQGTTDSDEWEEDYTSFKWFDTTYCFSKGNQAETVRVLWEAYQDGERCLTQETIGNAIGSEANKFSLRKTFLIRKKGRKTVPHSAWNTMIQEVEKGVYRLVPPKTT